VFCGVRPYPLEYEAPCPLSYAQVNEKHTGSQQMQIR
jgi:hypothetical protein